MRTTSRTVANRPGRTSAATLDANVVLRALLDDVPKQHDAAFNLLTNGGEFRVPDIAVAEVVFVLGRAYGLTREQQREVVVGFLEQPMILADVDLIEATFATYVRFPKLSFEDCYLAASAAIREETPLWTFDRKLASQGGAALVGE